MLSAPLFSPNFLSWHTTTVTSELCSEPLTTPSPGIPHQPSVSGMPRRYKDTALQPMTYKVKKGSSSVKHQYVFDPLHCLPICLKQRLGRPVAGAVGKPQMILSQSIMALFFFFFFSTLFLRISSIYGHRHYQFPFVKMAQTFQIVLI